jgi:hypothetical protein
MNDDLRPQPVAADQQRRYANQLHIGHNAFEFVLHFGQYFDGDSQPSMHTTIITSPGYAAAFLELLALAVKEYTEQFGLPAGLKSHE